MRFVGTAHISMAAIAQRDSAETSSRVAMAGSKFGPSIAANSLRSDGSNPCRHVQKFPEHRRERFLSPVVLGRLGDALREVEKDQSCSPWVLGAIRLLIFTGARRNEILSFVEKT